MNGDGSLNAGAFDFDSQSGIAHLLASVRGSELSAEQKNDLRDTVFLYANGGRDQSVRNLLQQKIVNYKLAPLGTAGTQNQQSPKTQDPSSFGAARPAPVFDAPAANMQPVSQLATPPPPPKPTTPPPAVAPVTPAPTPEPVRSAAPQPAAVPAPEPVRSEVPQTPEQPPTPATPSPPPKPTTPPPAVAPVTPAPTPEPAKPAVPQPAAVTAPEPAPQPASPQPNEAYLTRIREIKSAVNEKVGNPVNLVDINNEVGREYMGALLDAMKKINSGTSAVSAMKRLEEAFVAVNKAIVDHENNPQPQETKPTPPPPKSEPVATITPKPQPVTPPPAPKSIPEPVPPPPPPPPKPVPPRPQSEQSPASSRQESQRTGSGIVSSWGADTDTVKEKLTSFSDTKLSSLAESNTKPKSLSDLPTKETLNESTDGDPLFTKEVTDGLDQLLSEWSLFKKSGLFGTGPKGKEHPLFKKIAGLQIPLLLAGRFEGATQEIKQSITDYMNGWRYEQGIIYNQGETFEHYLRRVIRHILDLQKKREKS